MSEELLEEAMVIFQRMRQAYCSRKEGRNGLLHRWPDFIEDIDDLKKRVDRVLEEQDNLAVIHAAINKAKGADQ